jgi:hypothetical protein
VPAIPNFHEGNSDGLTPEQRLAVWTLQELTPTQLTEFRRLLGDLIGDGLHSVSHEEMEAVLEVALANTTPGFTLED